ncbi:DUF6152 family protein [Hyalangium sp.]|uniref:DUF6152 family protein n=1 Tax=Hyalangium sp. TaxID=2028555 RepID=UPI002D6018E6|nr:DUF6152 family protein [Hyalangium sp.]HYI01808.1 DUF6152 family protein [Hyalangium sp.]
MKRSWLTGVIGALGISGSALAHHGWSGYQSDKPSTLTGVIRESKYENPHGHVTLEVEGRKWHVVLAPPSRMERRGLTREELAVGAEATVEGYPHRTLRDELRAERITLSGETVELR